MNLIAKLCVTSILLISGPVKAADLISASVPEPSPPGESGWTFSATPYFWAAGLSGQTAAFGAPTIDVDASFSDIFKNLDFAAMAVAEARNGRYSIFGDLIYTKLSGSAATPLGILADSAELDASTFAGLLGAGYSLLDGPSGRLDIVGGVRMWSVDTDISFSGGAFGGQTFSDGATWVDGLVGVRGNFALPLSSTLRAGRLSGPVRPTSIGTSWPASATASTTSTPRHSATEPWA